MASFININNGLIKRILNINRISSPEKTPSVKYFPLIDELRKKLLDADN